MSSNGNTPSTASPGATGVVELETAELLGHGSTFCPNPRMALWSNHPRVYIDVGSTGEGRCPYCGTLYKLKAGAQVQGH